MAAPARNTARAASTDPPGPPTQILIVCSRIAASSASLSRFSCSNRSAISSSPATTLR